MGIDIAHAGHKLVRRKFPIAEDPLSIARQAQLRTVLERFHDACRNPADRARALADPLIELVALAALNPSSIMGQGNSIRRIVSYFDT
jgi:hypothetical protein